MKNIFIISARRSGTHLLTDLIINNFGYKRIDNLLDHDFLTNNNAKEFISEMKKGGRLAWSHFHDYDNFFNRPNIKSKYITDIKRIFNESKIIYIYRDIRDIITSYYYRPYNQKIFKSFNDFYRNCDLRDYTKIANFDNKDNLTLSSILLHNHNNWFSVYFAKTLLELDFSLVKFEDIINKYKSTCIYIANCIDAKIIKKLVDVRLTNIINKDPLIIYTSHDFRKGIIGDWKYLLHPKWARHLKNHSNWTGEDHLNAYLNTKVDNAKKYDKNIKNWKHICNTLEKERKYFQPFSICEHDINWIMHNRYFICDRKLDDIRYRHSVFYKDNYIIKYIRLRKHDVKTTKHVLKVFGLNIIKNIHNVSYIQNIPKVYFADIYNDDYVIIVQERIHEKFIIPNMFGIMNGYTWITKDNLFDKMLNLIEDCMKHNILLYDIIRPFNLALKNDILYYFDLDGIEIYDNITDLKSSVEYMQLINVLNEMDTCWKNKKGYSLLKKYKNIHI